MFGNNSFGNTSFGGSGFGSSSFAPTPSLGAFGTTQSQPQNQAPIGTTIRFVPLEGTDQVQKTGGVGGTTQVRTRHQNISAMKEYENKSTEELRLEDYATNRKSGNPPSAFGSTPFSSMPSSSTQPTTSLFGNQTQPTSMFGTPTQNQSSNVFGVQSSNNIFGSSLNKPATTAANSSPFQIGTPFNTTTSTAGGLSLFGNQTQTQTQPTTNLFGAPTQPQTSNVFGVNQNTTQSIFGSSMNKPATTVAGPSPFQIGGQTNTTTSTTGMSLFNTPSQPANTSLFGSSSLNMQQNKSSLFSAPATTNTSLTFGTDNNLNNQQQLRLSSTQPTTSLFGNQTQPTSNLFGTPTQNQSSNVFGVQSSNNIFGSSLNKPATTAANSSPFQIGTPFNTTTSTAGGLSLFGNQTQTQTQPTTNLFGAPTQPQTSNVFGVNQNTTQSIFGSSMNKPVTTVAGPSPFQIGGQTNTTTTTTGLSLFNTTSQPANTSLFGANTLNNQPKTSLFSAPATANTSLNFANDNNTTNQQQLRLDLLLNRLKTLPYGESCILPSDTNASSTGLGSLKFTTDPKTINQYKMKAKTNVSLNKPSSSEKRMANSVLFDGLDNNTKDDMRCAIDIFVPKKNIKKLDLTPSSHLSEGDADHAIDSPAFERSKSNLASRSMRDVTLDGSSSMSTRRVRFPDNTFPGAEPNVSYNPNFTNNTFNESNDISSLQNTSINRANISSQSFLNSSISSNRSGLGSRSGFINTRSDYRTKPSFDEIERRYNPETGACIVESLLIERPNYGSILFETPLDIKGINLDEIVHIRRKEVVVYPDDENKPPVGQGLNRPAIVTLHQVWPIDKSNSEIIKDIDRLNLMRYPEKIESSTINKGARFIEYRPETGSWVFGVKHFSKYGITDDDEELPPTLMMPPNNQPKQSPMPLQQQNQMHQTPLQHSPQNAALLLNRLKTTTPLSESPLSVNNSKQAQRSSTNQTPVSIKATPDSKQSNQFKMSAKTSLRLSEQTKEEKKTSSLLSESHFDNSLNYMRELLVEEEDDDDDDDLNGTIGDLKRSFTVHGNKRLALQSAAINISPTSYDKPIILGSSIPIQQKVRELKIKPNLYAAQNKLLRDIMSTCVSGAPKIRFINGSRKFCHVQGDKIVVNNLNLVPSESGRNELAEGIKKRFENYLENNSLITSLNMNPVLAPYIETNDFISDASSYGLLHALYGPLASKTPYAKQDERFNRVICWLSLVNQKLPQPTNIYQLIIYHMSCDRYDTASSLAMDNSHPRLALILSTLNLNKDHMIEQLTSWRISSADQHIDRELLKIYILLAGLKDWKLSNDVTVRCLEGLKWTQQLCLLAQQKSSFVTEPDKYGFYMLPVHINLLETDTNDVDYHIMARHSPANILSAAETLEEEWFLLESLKSFHVINSESECLNSDIIHCNLASQLGPLDLRWACFVALHIINNEVRNQVLIKCLEQNHSQLKMEKHDTDKTKPTMTVESWLVDKLQIPKEFLANVKSIYN